MGELGGNAVSLLGGLPHQLEAVQCTADLSYFLPTLMKARKIESAATAAGLFGQLINPVVFPVCFLVLLCTYRSSHRNAVGILPVLTVDQ